MSHVMNTYGRLPVAFERGEGVWLWDTQGKRYLDALAGGASAINLEPSVGKIEMTNRVRNRLGEP
jgi:acetylornithine/succinyldiaminopimelate/putrescine aminotransferase